MKLILFGTGDYYKKYSKWFRPEDIVALMDNDKAKQGIMIDGHIVVSPMEAVEEEYDYVVILSLHECEMRNQLMELGIAQDKIVGYAYLQTHRELIKDGLSRNLVISGKGISDFFASQDLSNTILMMSHTLDFSGATLALYYAAKVLISENYKVIFASWNDGELKDVLYRDGIPVIIEPNLEMCTANELVWVNAFDKVICNTMNYYNFLSARRNNGKFIWWLHDPKVFYETLNLDVFPKIKRENLIICAAGEIAGDAIGSYMPGSEVHQLLYGISEKTEKLDLAGKTDQSKKADYGIKLEAAVIANVQNYKGQDVLVKALSRLSDEELEILHVRIVGNTESAYASYVKSLAKGFENVVDFTGQVGREEVDKVLASTELLICPSRVDTMSVSCGEAMQIGVPCLVSDSIGMAEYIIDGENGLVFQNENEEELADKLRWCLKHREELGKIGNNGRRIYEEHFSMEVFRKNLMKFVRGSFGI